MKRSDAISIIIPVLHEEASIHSLITHVYTQFAGESFEVIVVDGDEQGSTLRVIQHPDVVTVRSRPGRGSQLNAGAARASGGILLFLHADTILPPEALKHARRVLSDGRYVAGAFKLGLDSDAWVFRLIATAASWRYRLTRLPYGDQAFFLTKAYFDRIGGFEEIPIMEDLELMRRIKRRGEKVHISKTLKVTTSVRRWQKEGIFYAVARTWMLAALYCAGVSPHTLLRYYRGHFEKKGDAHHE